LKNINEDIGKYGRIIVNWALKKLGVRGYISWIQLRQDRVQRRAFVNAVMNV